jgi:hypothetical protein
VKMPAQVLAALVLPAIILAVVLSFATQASAAGPAELYGKPLRGLSPVRIADILASPERYAGKSIRVVGTGANGSAGTVSLAEGSTSLRLETDGTFALPEKLDGTHVTAEGRVRKEASSPTPTFVAIGVEVKR